MKVFHGVDDLRAAAGTHLGHSDWHTITQDQVDAFAAAAGDHQWIHVDTEKAATGPFGSTIAHGFLTLSLLPDADLAGLQGRGRQRGASTTAPTSCASPHLSPVGSQVRAGVELLDSRRRSRLAARWPRG